jgi:hypothetical protein
MEKILKKNIYVLNFFFNFLKILIFLKKWLFKNL